MTRVHLSGGERRDLARIAVNVLADIGPFASATDQS